MLGPPPDLPSFLSGQRGSNEMEQDVGCSHNPIEQLDPQVRNKPFVLKEMKVNVSFGR